MMLPEDWPHRVRHSPLGNFDPHVTWLKCHVGRKHVDWDRSFGYWLFARQEDAAAFVVTWL
jgi:hypothetical protein